MAYLAFGDLGGAAMVRAQARAEVSAPLPCHEPEVEPRLSALEWSVVALARRDRESSLGQPSRWTRALRTLMGGHDSRLADPRLEALRRIAVLTWSHGYAVAAREVRRFVASGFTAAQYDLVARSIGAARQRPPRALRA